MVERRRWSAIWSYVLISLVLASLSALGVWRSRPFRRDPAPAPAPARVQAQQSESASRANSDADSDSRIIDVVKRVGPAVVLINTRVEKVMLDIFRRPVVEQEEGLGSGVIIDKDGYVLTNNHVIADADRILVTLPGKSPVKGTLVGGDAANDIAVVKIPGGKDLPVAPLGNSEKLQVGQGVIAIGNPLGFDNTVTVGVVSALGRTLATDENAQIELQDLIQTDASINPGNSGGPLLNQDGEVIGINTAIIAQAQGLGFSIPIHVARQVADDLIRHGKVLRLGVVGQNVTPEIVDQIAARTGKRPPVERGVLVVGVEPGSGAGTAGVRPGDILVELNGRTITEVADIRPLVRKAGFGGQVAIVVYREGKKLQLRGVLG